jgi:hypothetical protein
MKIAGRIGNGEAATTKASGRISAATSPTNDPYRAYSHSTVAGGFDVTS